MKKWFPVCIGLLAVLGMAAPSAADKVRLRYNLKAGQQWECQRLTHMSYDVMGKKHVDKQKHTLIYTVSKGTKKGWVRLKAKYINPPADAKANPMGMAQYRMTFTADMHVSGDTRNIKVDLGDAGSDPSIPAAQRAMMAQGMQMMADGHKDAVFWFPELPEDSLQPGDEFEDRRSSKSKNQYHASKTAVRSVYTLEDVSKDLAFFSSKMRMSTKMTSMGSKSDMGGAGKGDSVFDLESGMWSELVSKSKMTYSGGMTGSGGQDMLITNKVSMQLR